MEETETIQPNLEALKNVGGGLEILVELAEKGDIDPWDIDIIDITNKYLAALNSSPRENLLNAGRAIFFASVLLRLKSDILLNLSNETLLSSQQTEDFFPEDELLDDGRVHLDLSRLEGFIGRSSSGRQQRKRNVSLADLIFALQQAEEEEETRIIRAKLRAERLAHTIVISEFPDDVLEIAHEEDIDQITEKIESVIQEHLTEDKPITLSFLRELINDEYKPFIALLFLANSKKVVLEQDEFYGEVFIYKSGAITEQEKIRQEEERKENLEREKTEKKARKKEKKRKKTILARIKEKITGVEQVVKEGEQ